MRNDPIYLSQETSQEASLGVLSAAGNLCTGIISEIGKCVNAGHRLGVDLVLECLGDFGSLCEEREEEEFGSIEEVMIAKV